MTPISQTTIPSKKLITTLIGEELKSRYFFDGLRYVGLCDDFFQVDLLPAIMEAVGLAPDLQADYTFCETLLNKHCYRLVQDADEVREEATRVYDIILEYAIHHGQTSPNT